jgi:hypothetical protein
LGKPIAFRPLVRVLNGNGGEQVLEKKLFTSWPGSKREEEEGAEVSLSPMT